MNHSGPGGGNAAGHDDAEHFDGEWRKSSYSMSNGQCVEVALLASGHIGVRDSNATQGPILRFPPELWSAFLTDIRNT